MIVMSSFYFSKPREVLMPNTTANKWLCEELKPSSLTQGWHCHKMILQLLRSEIP
jgi:hypothetical protein